ncbi:uncharacterized protein SCHCODRAFT_01173469 [Schizophyllum commune H4-8]|nr:uncharacterized protein SCHCODRAFT_01173469 [Schizophyllum commune H4-8]KAI5888938.1 hypothetical protein SCHCODRAFT_01173469 [Schizophyllum commune H4-8]
MRTLDATLALMSEDVSSTYDPSIPLDAHADRPPSALISDAIGSPTAHEPPAAQMPSAAGSHAPPCQSTNACGSIGVALAATAAYLASVSSLLDKALGNSDPASAVCRGAVAGKTSYDLPGSCTQPSNTLQLPSAHSLSSTT